MRPCDDLIFGFRAIFFIINFLFAGTNVMHDVNLRRIIPLLATVSKDYCNFFPLGKVFVCLLRLIKAH